jgi:DNA-directed RNA polymerase subunit beta'
MQDFKAIKLLLASPEDILSWSYGEVKTSETINYRSLKAEPGGLMCERIFGPYKDYECYCGKYRKKKYKGIVCDKCGVEVTSSKVRRERMGHIKLAVPVVHVWYAYGVPCKLSILLNIPSKKLVSVIYYIRYIITEIDEAKRQEAIKELEDAQKAEVMALEESYATQLKELDDAFVTKKKAMDAEGLKGEKLTKAEKELDASSKERALVKKEMVDKKEEIDKRYESMLKLVKELQYKSIITEDDYRLLTTVQNRFFTADMGGDAIQKLLGDLDLQKLQKQLEIAYNVAKGTQRLQIERRLKLIEGFVKNNINPQWLVMKVIPVLPADLRPIVALAGGRFAISDLNDLYRRVINRNNRLKELMEIGAPDIILRNEKRMLQEAFDALIDNQHRFNKPVLNRMGIPYKSLTESLRGKKGRFRRNLLGKRVDYSGRAVIIPDTNLTVEQAGLPKLLALEIFKPFVVHKLIAKGIAATIKDAKDLIESYDERIWDVLEEVISTRTIFLNRPPTLHKYNIQAYYPVLVEGESVRLNQLVTSGYNADFDGDQMGIFAVLSNEALEESKKSMLSRYNLLKVADGTPLISFAKDMIMGLYHLTFMPDVSKMADNEFKVYANEFDAVRAYEFGEIKLQEPVKVLINGEILITTAGRLIFNSLTPKGFRFVNETLNKKSGNSVLRDIVLSFPLEEAIKFLDDAKAAAFHYATVSGFSVSVNELIQFEEKEELIKKGKQQEQEIQEQFNMGYLSAPERGRKVVDVWRDIWSELVDTIWKKLPDDNPFKLQVTSGANGDKSQAGQVMAMIGVVRDPRGNWVQFPILGNYSQGLNAYEYFVSARGGRKGAIDTALKTAQSGYMTRKLSDVSQDVIVRMEDCGYDGEGHIISRSDIREASFAERMIGRWTTQDVVHPTTGDVIVAKGSDITVDLAKEIDKAGINEVLVRSAMLCKSPIGVCATCYGYDFGTYKKVELGKAVGVMAAQSISEPMTQMTLRTFHGGGVGADITSGIPRIIELVEAREPKRAGTVSPIDGKVKIEENKVVITGEKTQKKRYIIHENYELYVQNEQEVSKGDKLFAMTEGLIMKAPFDGKIEITGRGLYVVGTAKTREEMKIPSYAEVVVADGETVSKGAQLTSGSIDPKSISDFKGLYYAQKYVLDESQKVFLDYGINIRDVHVEIITRQMTKLAKVVDPGDTGFVRGTFINRFLADYRNELLEKEGKKPMVYDTRLLGVTFVSLNAESILAAMSFQEQVKVLSEAAIVGRTDFLRGLKENVIIGRLIPVDKRAIISEIDNLEELTI